MRTYGALRRTKSSVISNSARVSVGMPAMQVSVAKSKRRPERVLLTERAFAIRTVARSHDANQAILSDIEVTVIRRRHLVHRERQWPPIDNLSLPQPLLEDDQVAALALAMYDD